MLGSLKSLWNLYLDGASLSTIDIFNTVVNNWNIAVTDEALVKIESSYKLLNTFIEEKRVIYGVNTSLGGFLEWLIPKGCGLILMQKELFAYWSQYYSQRHKTKEIIKKQDMIKTYC